MYQTMNGLSLPSGLTNFLKGLTGAVVRGTTVTVPTPIGPQTFNLGVPEERAQLERMIRGARVSVTPPQPGVGQNAARFVENRIPGGWATVAIAAVALIFGAGMFTSRRRQRA